jgi:tetratricopeptide (TPR) repeat protein
MYRRHHGFDVIDLNVVANDEADGFRVETLKTPTDAKNWMLQNVLLQCHGLLPACRRTIYWPLRTELEAQMKKCADSFPAEYSLERPVPYYVAKEVTYLGLSGYPYASLAAEPRALAQVDDWLNEYSEGRRAIVITLRGMTRQPGRNSDLEAWTEFARSLDPDLYFPVFVRDTAAIFSAPPPELEGFALFDPAALNLHIRMALYERAYLNMIVNNGPIALLNFNTATRYLQFRPQQNNNDTSERYLGKIGFTAEYDPFRKTSHQKVLMDGDTLDNIRNRFDEMVEIIQNQDPPIMEEWAPAETWMHRFAKFGSFDDAERILNLLLLDAEAPENLIAAFDLAVAGYAEELLADGFHLDAKNGYDMLIRRSPGNIEFALARLNVLAHLFDFTSIIDTLEQLEAMGVDISSLLLLWGQCLTKAERYQEAVLKFRAYFSVNSENADVLIDYGIALRGSGDREGQILALNRAVELIPPGDADTAARVISAIEMANAD